MKQEERFPHPRWAVPVVEAIVVFFFWSLLVAILLPAVDVARELRGEPLTLPWLAPWYTQHRWLFLLIFPALSTSVLTFLLLIIRSVLPRSARAYLPWKPIPYRGTADAAARPKRESGIPAVSSAVLAAHATALLLFVALHVRADRTQRRPVVTWEGPAGPYVLELAVIGWLLSIIAMFLAAYALHRCHSRWNGFGLLALILAPLNFFGSCFFWGAVYED